ncbi:MAG: alpha/beta hydrolase [Candidatus Dormibacteraeota bacterium]|nr:alpha/beta hydrolase [Candidatus Dormibacteraeota bacterium]
MTQHTTISDGLRITYDDSGEGSPALVLIHGAFANRTHFVSQVEHLTPRHRVITLDIRGHGDSEAPTGPFGVQAAASDVIAVCDAAGVDRAVFCGHSWPVSLEVATRRPNLVAGVAMLDGAVLLPAPLRAEILRDLVPVLEGPGWIPATQAFLVGRNFPFDAPALKARISDEISNGPANLAAQMMRDCMSTDWSEQIAVGTYPLLYVHGRIPLEIDRLRQLRPDALVGAIVGGGHYISLEVPEQVNAMLERFLELIDVEGAPASRTTQHVAGAVA